MDVLELPKPVINFLRTMSSEKEKYLLTWDLYGDGNSVTLSLTWKLNNELNTDNNTDNNNSIKTSNLIQKCSTTKSSSAAENIHSISNKKLNKNKLLINNYCDKNDITKFIPPPSAASLLAHKSILSDKKEKDLYSNSNIVNSNCKSSVKFSSNTVFNKETNRRTPSRDANFSRLESDSCHYNNSSNMMKNSNSMTSCLYFPSSNKKLDAKAKKQNKNKSDIIHSRLKFNSESNLNEDSYDETCNECKNISSTLRIVDHNLQSPVYKYANKNVRSIQNLNNYQEEYDTDDEDEDEEKEEDRTKKKNGPWIKKKNSNMFNSKI